MSWQKALMVKGGAVLAAALLLTAPEALAGDRAHAASRSTIPSQPAPSRVTHSTAVSRSFSVGVTTLSQPATQTLFVDICGPDGQVRRFPVEGGRAAIQYHNAYLRPGEMLTIHWTPTK